MSAEVVDQGADHSVQFGSGGGAIEDLTGRNRAAQGPGAAGGEGHAAHGVLEHGAIADGQSNISGGHQVVADLPRGAVGSAQDVPAHHDGCAEARTQV